LTELSTRCPATSPRYLSRRRLLGLGAAIGAAAVAANGLGHEPAPALAFPTGRDGGQHPTAAADDADFALLTERVRALMAEYQVPGVGLGLLYQGRQWMTGLGVTNIDYPLPVDEDTLFPLGSIAKTFTATALVRLAEEGRVDLDAPVRRYVPDFRVADEEVSRRVTVRQTLTHAAGWVGEAYGFFEGEGDDALAKFVADMAPLPQVFPLGALFGYNNAAFNLAGRVIELVTGQTFEEAIGELILLPLGMDRSTYFARDAITYATVSGHDLVDGTLRVMRNPWSPIPRASNPAGGIISSIRDVLRYARFHLGDGVGPDGTRLLSPAGMQQMRTPQTGPGTAGPTDADGIGIAWVLLNVDGTRILAHDGGISNRFQTRLQLIPERQFALTILTNHGSGGKIFEPVTAWALEHYLGLRNPSPAAYDLPADQARQYVGRYVQSLEAVAELQALVRLHPEELSAADLVLTYEISRRDGRLYYQDLGTDEQFSFGFYRPDGAIVLDGPSAGERFDFLRDARGAVGWVRRNARAVPKVS
jgi:CubicO group peptidase (beta-lactamase class C family)